MYTKVCAEGKIDNRYFKNTKIAERMNSNGGPLAVGCWKALCKYVVLKIAGVYLKFVLYFTCRWRMISRRGILKRRVMRWLYFYFDVFTSQKSWRRIKFMMGRLTFFYINFLPECLAYRHAICQSSSAHYQVLGPF